MGVLAAQLEEAIPIHEIACCILPNGRGASRPSPEILLCGRSADDEPLHLFRSVDRTACRASADECTRSQPVPESSYMEFQSQGARGSTLSRLIFPTLCRGTDSHPLDIHGVDDSVSIAQTGRRAASEGEVNDPIRSLSPGASGPRKKRARARARALITTESCIGIGTGSVPPDAERGSGCRPSCRLPERGGRPDSAKRCR